MAGVRFTNLTKVYPSSGKAAGVTAVKGISFDVREGEFMVLVGPSGCGKSTTLRMLAGLETITNGECYIGDRLVNDVPPKDRDIAMVFQNYALYPHMTVFDNMSFGLKLRKVSREEIKARVHEAAAILGLEDLLDRRPKALSGGQRQRVAVGRAIVRKPKVFLFDEPLSNLDAKMRIQMRAEISRLRDKLDATMIYVTHDQVEAMTMGDRICVMNGGEIMQLDEPLRLYNQPQNKFVAGFVGSPPMNFFRGRVDFVGVDTQFVESVNGEDGFAIPLDDELADTVREYSGKPIVLGIRPENISPESGSDEIAIEAKINVCETTGSEMYLYLNTGLSEFVAKVPTENRFSHGETVRINLDLSRAHFFDPETGKVIVTKQT